MEERITRKSINEAIASMGATRNERHGVVTEILTVTPSMAATWLENPKNPQNRMLNEWRVKQYADQMKRGLWRVNNQGILLGKNGELYDGQHRLWAVIMAECSVQMLVVRGVRAEVRITVDKNQTRSVGQDLTMQFNIPYGNRVATIVRNIQTLIGGEGNRKAAPSTVVIMELLGKYHEGVSWTVNFLNGARKFDNGYVCAPIAYAYKTNPSVVMQFAERLKEGEKMQKGDPAFECRHYIYDKLPYVRETKRRTMLKILNAVFQDLQGNSVKGGLKPNFEALRYFAKAHQDLKALAEEDL